MCVGVTAMSTMIKALVSILSAVVIAGTAWASQVGDVIQEKVDSAVVIPDNQIRQVASITLDKGTWLVSGQLNFIENKNFGRSLVGGATAPAVFLPADGTAQFQSGDTSSEFQVVAVTLAPKAIDLTEDKTIFLVAFNRGRPNPPTVPSFVRGGLLTAVKVKAN